MHRIQVEIHSDERPELDVLLGDRLYEFNASTTGIHDGVALNASVENDRGDVVAGISGHTWGGCCEITRLWVHESERHGGIGSALVQAAEREARQRGCRQIVLSTHSFQAPRFYEHLGFRRIAAIPDYPRGHESIIMMKEL